MSRLHKRALILAILIISFPSVSAASGNIDGTNKYAFSNVGGYVNFAPTNGGVTVTDSTLTGYAWSENDGWINLSPAESGVLNDGEGNLSGFAWDSVAGWVNFSGVTIDSSGQFHGQATGGTVNGASYAISFDCTNCNVMTSWRPSGTTYGSYSPPASPSSPPTNPPLGGLPPSATPPTRPSGGGGGPSESGGLQNPAPRADVPTTSPSATTSAPASTTEKSLGSSIVTFFTSIWNQVIIGILFVGLVAFLRALL